MKSIITIFALLLVAFTAAAQTNIIVKITVEETGFATNSATLKLDGDGSKRDQMFIAGQVAKFNAQSSLGTNAPASVDVMIKNQVKAMLEYDGLAYNAKLQAALLVKLGLILTEQPELLTDSDKAQLTAIASKLP